MKDQLQNQSGDHPWIEAAKKLADQISKKHPKMKKFSAVETIRCVREERDRAGT